jgi:hypothetical protein
MRRFIIPNTPEGMVGYRDCQRNSLLAHDDKELIMGKCIKAIPGMVETAPLQTTVFGAKDWTDKDVVPPGCTYLQRIQWESSAYHGLYLCTSSDKH